MQGVAAVSKSFTEHLAENSFYFHTINDPDLTIYGQKILKTDKKEKKKKEQEEKGEPVTKDKAANSFEKLATYLKIANNIQ